MLNRNTLNKGHLTKLPSISANEQVDYNFFTTNVERVRRGVPIAAFLENIHKTGISKTRAAQIFKIHRSKLVYKISASDMLVGIDALAAIRLEQLCRLAENIVLNSLHQEAQGFDSAKWLGTWLELPQAALGGQKPAELMETEAGAHKVLEVLGAIESGVYL